MSIRPEDLTISGLPRSSLPGGIKVSAAADFLERAAWDYRTALGQAQQLAKTVGEQARRIKELEAQIASLEADVAARRDPDELARRLLASAREEREEARRESQLLLKKAERRAERIELAAHRRLQSETSQLKQFDVLREQLRDGVRSALETIMALDEDGAFTRETT
jgi:chromosome segregation ATPase